MKAILPLAKHCTLSNLCYLLAIAICLCSGVYMFMTFSSDPAEWAKFAWETLAVSALFIFLGLCLAD